MNIHDLAEKAGKSGDDILDFVRLNVVMMRENPDLVREVTVEPCEDYLVKSLDGKIALKACYHNTWEAIQLLTKYKFKDVRYVLGYWCHIIPVEHCFLKYNNNYYDPTALLFDDNSQTRYFSLYELDITEVMATRKFMKRQYNINNHIGAYEWLRMNKMEGKP